MQNYNIAQSADDFLIRPNDGLNNLQKKNFAQAKKIQSLELELELAKERLTIGSQILTNLVKETKNSLKYVL